MKLFNDINFSNLNGDLFGGLTAAIIALPMALAFGVASGAGPAAGLYGAILIGLFASLFGSTPTLISEPTGPMTVIMTAVIANLIASNPEHGMAMAFTVVMMAGSLQVLFGFLKLGHYVTLMPYTVISGFMTGIGAILIILQFAPFLGHAPPAGGVIGSIQALPDLIDNIKPVETLLAVSTLLLIVFYPAKLNRFCPPHLIALVAGSIITVYFFADDNVRRIGEIPTGFPEFNFPVFDSHHLTIMFADAAVLAVLGSIDALLTSVVAENMTRKESDANKELTGQGIGNMVSGLFGGLPGAGATMGSVLNIKAGATSALSGLFRVLVLVLVILWAADLTEQIPLAVLSGIAFKVGYDIIDWSFIKRAHRVSPKATMIMYTVILLTVFIDLITAVAIGVFISYMLTIERISELQSDSVKTYKDSDEDHHLTKDEQTLLHQTNGNVLVFKLGGPLMFGLAKLISRKHAVLDNHQILIVDLTDVPSLGVSASLAIENVILEDINDKKPVFIVGANDKVLDRLTNLGIIDQLQDNAVYPTSEDALKVANELLESNSTDLSATT